MTSDDVVARGPGYLIRRRDLDVTFVRSSGPGGQNVNKVATKAVLRLRLDDLGDEALAPGLRPRLEALAGSRLTRDGELILTSDRHRDQPRNLDDVLTRLADLFDRAAHPPAPRKATNMPSGARTARRRTKAARAGVKRLRGRVDPDDD